MTRLYKLLIADDEQIVIDSVKFMVEKFIHTAIDIETAHSGRQAIDRATAFHPDIVVTDIKMPGINGLDAITEIKKINPGALFIIITAFANFDFAKEALSLGVIEYLNKPLNRAKFVTALEHAISIKDNEQKRRKTELDFKEKMSFVLPALESSFVYSAVMFDDHTAEMESLKKILGIESESGYVMTIEFGEGKNKDGVINKIGSGIKNQKIYPFLRDAIKENCKCIVGPVMLNRIITYVPCVAFADEYEQRIEALETGTKIYEKLKGIDPKIDYYIGIGRSYSALKDIARSYEESLRAIDYIGENGVVHINDIPVERNAKNTFFEDAEKAMMSKIISGDTDGAIFAFEHIMNCFGQNSGVSASELKSRLLELVVMILGVCKDYELDIENTAISSCICEYMAIDNAFAIKSFVKDIIRRVSDSVAKNREKNFSCVIKSAVNYIEKNFGGNITLEDVSKEVNISPTYFSKMFKEETGSTFIDYLTTLRIGRAKELIAEGNCGNKEICELVGYSDPNYFSRVFKKIVGASPTEYKASFINS